MEKTAMIYRGFKENKAPVFVISALLLCMAIGWAVYVLFGHPLINDMCKSGSIEILNGVIKGQAIRPIAEYYQGADPLYRTLFERSIFIIIGVLICGLFVKRKTKPESSYFYLLFALCLAIHLMLSLVGWENSLSDRHGFRQTQTAITTYYVIKDGFRLDYITPILGKPWSIPFEFPLYQWIVAAFVLISRIHLEQAGRFISLAFFYLSLIPIYQLLGYFVTNKSHRLTFLCLLLASPIYIFWPRTFMIESLAVFLSLVFLDVAARAVIDRKPVMLLSACALGGLAVLVKTTTFLVYCIPAFSLCVWLWARERKSIGFSPKQFANLILIFAVPLIIGAGWVMYADHLKSLNPLAGDFTAEASKYWIFGTITQKLSLDTWKVCASHLLVIAGIRLENLRTLLIFTFFAGAIFSLKKSGYHTVALLSLGFFLAGPVIFTNLYVVHDYYWYSNSIFLLTSMGFLILPLLENEKWKGAGKYAIIPTIILSMYFSYFNSYFQVAARNKVFNASLVKAIQGFTKEDDILLIYGFDWSAELPYYSQRRAIMIRSRAPQLVLKNDKKFQRALEELKEDKIAAMVVRKNAVAVSTQYFIQERVARLGLLPNPVFQNSEIALYAQRKQ